MNRYTRVSEWTNERGTVYLDLICEDGKVWEDGFELECLAGVVNTDGQMIIEFLSTGYEDSGQLYGPPEKCYPPEGSDERTLDKVSVETVYDTIRLTPKQANIIFDIYETDVYEADLDCD